MMEGKYEASGRGFVPRVDVLKGGNPSGLTLRSWEVGGCAMMVIIVASKAPTRMGVCQCQWRPG